MNKQSNSKLIVKSYKPSGKWYHTEETELCINSIEETLKLEEKIKANDPDVKSLSGLISGFDHYFTFMIELIHEDIFMDFLLRGE